MKSHLLVAAVAAIGVAAMGAQSWGLTEIDLTTAGSSGTANGALFYQGNPQPTGSGVFGSFLRVQAHGTDTFEQGYNANGSTPFDTKSGVSYNNGKDLTVGDLSGSQIDINGECYVQLALDINQADDGGDKYLSLDSLAIYTAPPPHTTFGTVTSTNPEGSAPDFSSAHQVYTLGDYYIGLNNDLAPGSGHGDMLFLLPSSAFAGTNATDAVYLYAAFGDNTVSTGGTANGGFEEFGMLTNPNSTCGPLGNPPPIPEPMSLALIPLALIGLGLRKKLAR